MMTEIELFTLAMTQNSSRLKKEFESTNSTNNIEDLLLTMYFDAIFAMTQKNFDFYTGFTILQIKLQSNEEPLRTRK